MDYGIIIQCNINTNVILFLFWKWKTTTTQNIKTEQEEESVCRICKASCPSTMVSLRIVYQSIKWKLYENDANQRDLGAPSFSENILSWMICLSSFYKQYRHSNTNANLQQNSINHCVIYTFGNIYMFPLKNQWNEA